MQSIIQQRDIAIQKIQSGQQHFDSEKDLDKKQAALRLYIQGIDDMCHYIKYETNQQVLQLAKQKVSEFMSNAEQMKAQINKLLEKEDKKNKNTDLRHFSYFNKVQQGMNQQNQQQNNINNNQQNPQKIALKQVLTQEEQKQNNDISNMVVDKPQTQLKWEDIAGLDAAKKALQEAVILPAKFPSLFTGLRQPWKGILLYGPPGTGKTFLAKVCASQCQATFFSVSSADIVSKYVGESEKMLKGLFQQARQQKPSIIFIDEIDSMASSREGNQGGQGSENSNRLKTQLLVEMQGVNGDQNDGVLVVGATNLPWALDSAVRRRLEKRIYIPLPDIEARTYLLNNLLKKTDHSLKTKDIKTIAQKTQNFSGADISILVKDACMMPVRLLQNTNKFLKVKEKGKYKYKPCKESEKKGISMNYQALKDDELILPPITIKDFNEALSKIKPSVGQQDLNKHIQFTKEYGEQG